MIHWTNDRQCLTEIRQIYMYTNTMCVGVKWTTLILSLSGQIFFK